MPDRRMARRVAEPVRSPVLPLVVARVFPIPLGVRVMESQQGKARDDGRSFLRLVRYAAGAGCNPLSEVRRSAGTNAKRLGAGRGLLRCLRVGNVRRLPDLFGLQGKYLRDRGWPSIVLGQAVA